MQRSNKYKIDKLEPSAFITMNDSMYEGQEGEKQEANFKQKFKQLFLNIGHKISKWYNNCISSIKNCSCFSKENINSGEEQIIN